MKVRRLTRQKLRRKRFRERDSDLKENAPADLKDSKTKKCGIRWIKTQLKQKRNSLLGHCAAGCGTALEYLKISFSNFASRKGKELICTPVTRGIK